MYEAPFGYRELQFVAQLAHVYVYGAVVLAVRAAPDSGVQLLATDDPALALGERIEEGELANGQRNQLIVDLGDELVWPDVEDHAGRFARALSFPVKGPQLAGKQPVTAAPANLRFSYTPWRMDRLRLAVIDADSGFVQV